MARNPLGKPNATISFVVYGGGEPVRNPITGNREMPSTIVEVEAILKQDSGKRSKPAAPAGATSEGIYVEGRLVGLYPEGIRLPNYCDAVISGEPGKIYIYKTLPSLYGVDKRIGNKVIGYFYVQ